MSDVTKADKRASVGLAGSCDVSDPVGAHAMLQGKDAETMK